MNRCGNKECISSIAIVLTWPWEGRDLCRSCWRAALDAYEDLTGTVRTAGVLASIVATEKERRPRRLKLVRYN